MTYLFAAYSVVFLLIFVYTFMQGRRISQLTRDLKHLQELEETLRDQQAGSFYR